MSSQRDGRTRLRLIIVGLALVASMILIPVGSSSTRAEAATATGPLDLLGTYQGNNSRTGYDPNPFTFLGPGNVRTLKTAWTNHGGTGASAQPIVVGPFVFWGDWSGKEHATNLFNGADLWSADLGVSTGCYPPTTGVVSSAAVAYDGTRHLVYVGGGDGVMYALDALTGATVWSVPLGAKPSAFVWGSPTVYGDSVYIGLSSYGGCPYIQGKLFQLDGRTGAVRRVFNVVPDGCTGGSITSTAAIDERTGILYLTTGNDDLVCPEPYATAMVALRASDLSVLGSWHVPTGEYILDGDFIATPTLFDATIGGQRRSLVGASNKNGTFYAFDRSDVSAGPVWRRSVANPGACACDGAAISNASFDGRWLYVAGGKTTVNGVVAQGSVQALDPATGAVRWRNATPGPVYAGLTGIPGLLIVPTGTELQFLDPVTGWVRFRFTGPSLGKFWGTASVQWGAVLVPNMNGDLIALAPTRRIPWW